MSESGNWVREALAGVLERIERQQAEAEEHARTCTARPCERCERYFCRRCGVAIDGPTIIDRTCRACAELALLDQQLRATRDSIPPHFRWAYTESPAVLETRVTAKPELVRRALENPPNGGMVLLGATGAGKTSLAVAMLDAWVRKEPRSRSGATFVEAGWLSRARARHKLGADEAPLVAQAMVCPLLVLDDLGSEREDRDGCITDVLWTRTNHDRPIWITCGLASEHQTTEAFAEAIARRYDGGFARRILETSKIVRLG